MKPLIIVGGENSGYRVVSAGPPERETVYAGPFSYLHIAEDARNKLTAEQRELALRDDEAPEVS